MPSFRHNRIDGDLLVYWIIVGLMVVVALMVTSVGVWKLMTGNLTPTEMVSLLLPWSLDSFV